MYSEEKLVGIAKRENNTKRKYLVVNRLQGKHVPVSPKEAFEMFSELAGRVKEAYEGERLLMIGFAETATAIGAALAVELGTLYMQTTREKIPGVQYLYFSESHSHATEQKLVKDDIDKVIDGIDRIVFVEDEVTTGNTILKIINLLEKEYPGKAAFAVASLLNGMGTEALDTYRNQGIPVHYLVKTDHSAYAEIAQGCRGDGRYQKMEDGEAQIRVKELSVPGGRDARRCVSAEEYRKACEQLWKTIRKSINLVDKQRILALGTEEFMYPALYIAEKIEKDCPFVRCHATTRSPIEVSVEKDYPLHVRYELKSLYEKDRRTFLYDLEKYDTVLILTDAKGVREGENTLVNALYASGNEEIILIRWCED